MGCPGTRTSPGNHERSWRQVSRALSDRVSRLKYALSLRCWLAVRRVVPAFFHFLKYKYLSSPPIHLLLQFLVQFVSRNKSVEVSLIKRSQDVSLLVPKTPPSPCLYRGNIHCTSTSLPISSPPPRQSWKSILYLCHKDLSTSEQRVHRSCQDEPEQLSEKCTCGR